MSLGSPDKRARVTKILLHEVSICLFSFFLQALKIKCPHQLDQKVIEKQLPGKKNASLSCLHTLSRWPRSSLAGSKTVPSCLTVCVAFLALVGSH